MFTEKSDGDGLAAMAFDLASEVRPVRRKRPAGVPCFVAGALVKTASGEVAVESLRPGDRVLTRDNGYQPVIWQGRQRLLAADLTAYPELAPVWIRAGALGPNCPDRDLLVSPRHRMLLTDVHGDLSPGAGEVLAPAQAMLSRPGIQRALPGKVNYVHLLFERHEIIMVNGAWSESFHPGSATVNALGGAQRREVLSLCPGVQNGRETCAYRLARPQWDAI